MNKTLATKPREVSYPHCHTFAEYMAWLASYGDRPALAWFTRRKEQRGLTYRELTQKAAALGRALQDIGVRPGDHVAIISENSADWLLSFFALTCLGCVTVCMDTEQSDESIRDMVRRSDAGLLLLSPTFLSICLPLLDEDPARRAVLMGGTTSDDRVGALDDLYERGAALPARPPVPLLPGQTAEIVFTSGTTSQSKMVMLTHDAILQNVFDASSYVDLKQRVFCSLPFYHAYGLNCAVLNSLYQGTCLAINGDLKTVMRDLHLAKPDTMLTVPLMVEAIHNQIWLTAEREGKADALRRLLKLAGACRALHLPVRFKPLDQLREKAVGSLRLAICGGAHLSREISEEFDLLGVQMLQGYGITECCPLISVNRNAANRMGSVGLALPSWEVKLEAGEVCVRGPSVMQGYYKDPEQTAQALVDGWFCTGDLGHIDRDGFLHLTGRKKNLIVFKNGKKVSPEKLEELLSAIPLVKEVVVSGSANGLFADDVKLTASIYPDPQRAEGLSSYEILDLLQRGVDKINRDLPSYQQIQLVNIREKEFSKTGTRKIKRHDG